MYIYIWGFTYFRRARACFWGPDVHEFGPPRHSSSGRKQKSGYAFARRNAKQWLHIRGQMANILKPGRAALAAPRRTGAPPRAARTTPHRTAPHHTAPRRAALCGARSAAPHRGAAPRRAAPRARTHMRTHPHTTRNFQQHWTT
jgi:hypothetical protein